MPDVVIRSFRPEDRAAVRRICCDTADKGKPVEGFFRDREAFADLITRYYTDYAPQGTWVAQQGQTVAGYLTGCFDTRRYWSIMVARVIPSALIRALGRGTFLQAQTWGVVRAGIGTFFCGGFQEKVSLEDYPAHLHINLLADARGQHSGERLIEGFIEQVKTRGLKGIHLVTRSDNAGARRFFERRGFVEIGHCPVASLGGGGQDKRASVVYGLRL